MKALVAALALVGCGVEPSTPDAGAVWPSEGYGCVGALLCADGFSAHYCEEASDGHLRLTQAFNCPSGCSNVTDAAGEHVKCDPHGIRAGEGCSEHQEGIAVCNDPQTRLKCERGVWVETKCSACVELTNETNCFS